MKKLKKQIFITIFSVLTFSVLTFIVIFNTQNYLEKYTSIKNNLNVSNQNHDMPPKLDENNDKNDDKKTIKFMDTVMYTVLLDNGNIKDVINHSNDDISDNTIKKIAKKILNGNLKEKHIGFLYLENYSYTYNENELVILDNTKVKNELLKSLYISILIFIILEVIIYKLSNHITLKIVKPVKMSFEKQKTFIADASHELKTPLSVIIASSEALQDNPNETKWLKNIKLEAERMNLLITDLLELASSEVKPKQFKLENISKIISLQVLTFEGKAFEENIKLKYDIKDNINMKIDENSIKQLTEILLDNAIKHSYKNETVEINLNKEKNNIILTVKNKGDEIPKGEEEKIFERFYRIDKSRNRKENRYGLGLAIAKNIVTNHGGVIKATSFNNVTTFMVIFKDN